MKNKVKFFTETEKGKLWKELERKRISSKTDYAHQCAIRNEAMFKVMWYCALRVSEASMMPADAFNPLKNQIYCSRLKGGINNTLEILDKDVLAALKRHIRYNSPKTYMFENQRDGKALSRKTMDAILKTACRDAGLSHPDKWHCHTLRHTRAVDLADAGLDIKELQFWLGHAEVSNTLIYFQFTTKQQEALYRKIRRS